MLLLMDFPKGRVPTLLAPMFLLTTLIFASTTMATEEPNYQVVRAAPGFELRRYGPMLVAETEVSGTFSEVGGEAFQRLAGFIFGDNQTGQKIEMTAPVIQQPLTPVKTDALAPAGESGTYVLAFVMPKGFSAESLPRPKDQRIQVREEPPRLMAVRRYSGLWTWDNYRENETALMSAVRDAGLEPQGRPVYARYNAPFVPWFMRRNEVMVEVREGAGTAVKDQAAGTPPAP